MLRKHPINIKTQIYYRNSFAIRFIHEPDIKKCNIHFCYDKPCHSLLQENRGFSIDKSYELINYHMQRRPMILCSNDAKSCYDRIVHSIAILAMRRMGMPLQPLKSMMVTIQKMSHHVRTAFGNSESTMTNDDPIPFQGIRQGNGCGPTLWLAVSAPLLEMMRTAGNGLHLKTPLSNEQDFLVGFAFVDDTDIVAGDLRTGTLSIEEVFTKGYFLDLYNEK